MAVLFLNIILLNFIIAVISQSYEKVMQKLKAQTFKMKAAMIREAESHMPKHYFTNQKYKDKYFPRFLILRRPTHDVEQGQKDWEGFIKDIKRSTHEQVISAQENHKKHNLKIEDIKKEMTA